jgi:hypothetical protein
MSSRKPAMLSRKSARPDDSARRHVAIEGRCSIGGREAQDVMVTDLDPTGCRMRANAVGVTKAEPLKLWFGATGPIDGRLKWTKGGALGVSFETPLEDELLETLYRASLLSNVIPLRS